MPNHDSTADETAALVAKAQHGDRAALDSLTERYWPEIHERLAARFARERRLRCDPDEEASEVATRVFTALPSVLRTRYKEEGKFPAFLHTMAHYRFLERVRELLKVQAPLIGGTSLLDRVKSVAAGPATLLQRAQISAVLSKAMGRLRPTEQRLLSRKYFDDAGRQTIARELNITPNNTDVRLHRARQRLEERLRAEGADETWVSGGA